MPNYKALHTGLALASMLIIMHPFATSPVWSSCASFHTHSFLSLSGNDAATLRRLINTDLDGIIWAHCLLACTAFLCTHLSPIVKRRRFCRSLFIGRADQGDLGVLFTQRCPCLTLFARDLEPDADGIVFTIHNQTGAPPRVYSAELIASPQVACLCIATGDRFVYQQSFFPSLPADPYQILGPTSSRLANPGKILHAVVLRGAHLPIKRFLSLTFLMRVIECSPNELWELKAWTGCM